MGSAELIVDSGPDKSLKIKLDDRDNRVALGHGIDGQGRLQAPRGGNLAADHLTLWLHHFGLEVAAVNETAHVMYTGAVGAGDLLNPGHTLIFADEDPRQLRRDVAAVRVMSVKPEPTFGRREGALFEAVAWRTGRWKTERGVLEAVDNQVSLHGKEGPLFTVPIQDADAKFPRRRSGVISLQPGEERYKVFLGGGDGGPSLSGDTNAGSIGGAGGDPSGSAPARRGHGGVARAGTTAPGIGSPRG